MADTKTAVDMIEDHEPRKGSITVNADAALHGDRALAMIGDERVRLTEEDVCDSDRRNSQSRTDQADTDPQNKRIRRKTNKVILTILIWVYFLQIVSPNAYFDSVVQRSPPTLPAGQISAGIWSNFRNERIYWPRG